MDWQTLQQALDAAQSPQLDDIYTADQLTLGQWLQQQIFIIRDQGTLDELSRLKWNAVVPEEYRIAA